MLIFPVYNLVTNAVTRCDEAGLRSNEPQFGVHLDRRAVHHMLRRVDCADVNLPVAPAISDALTAAQKLLGGTAGQAGEKCDQDGHAARGPGRCPVQCAVAVHPQPRPGVLRVHLKRPSCTRRRVCPPPPKSSVNNNLELTTLFFFTFALFISILLYIYISWQNYGLSHSDNRTAPTPTLPRSYLPSSFNIVPTCGAPTPTHILVAQSHLSSKHPISDAAQG